MEIFKTGKANAYASVTCKFACIASVSFWNFRIYVYYVHLDLGLISMPIYEKFLSGDKKEKKTIFKHYTSGA